MPITAIKNLAGGNAKKTKTIDAEFKKLQKKIKGKDGKPAYGVIMNVLKKKYETELKTFEDYLKE